MPGASDEETSIRAYLLGELPPDRQTRIEERLLMDRDYMEILLVLEDELTDSYLRGALSERERTEFEDYFLTTPARQRKLRMARALRRYVNNQPPISSTGSRGGLWARIFGKPFLTHAWSAAIAALLVMGVALGIWLLPGRESLTDKGRTELQAALRESPIEGRIAGFDWSPQRVTLGEHSNSVADRISFESAERDLLDAVRSRPDSDSHYALGQFYLAKRDLDSAIEQFNQALPGAEKNERLQSDLGAALLERGRAARAKGSDNSLQEFATSLDHLDKALELNDSLLEARFNRALCYEYMQLPAQAENDWRNYLNRDANSAWADEVRRHLNDLEEKKRTSENADTQLKDFQDAFQIGDRDRAWKLVSQNRDLLKGRLIWWQLLDEFFASSRSGAPAETNRSLQMLEYAGDLKLHPAAEGQHQSDPYISELAAFYRSSSTERRSSLAEAHARVNEGNQLLLQGQYDQAAEKYSQAESNYSREGDRWEALLAKLLTGTSSIQKGDEQQSRTLFDAVSEQCRERGYVWLRAESCYGLGRVHDRLAEHSKALEYTAEALKLADSIDDGYNAQRSLAQVADQYRKLGNYDLSISSLNRCLGTMSRTGWAGARQMFRNCDQLMQVLAAKRLYAAAAAYGQEALRLAPEIEDPRFVYVSASHLGLIRGKQGNYPEALRLTRQGLEAANSLPDETERSGYLAYTSLQLGDLNRQAGSFAEALADYDQAIQRTASGNIPMVAYGAHQGRLRCQIALKNDAEAEAELSKTLGLLEQYRTRILEEQNSNIFFDREQSVYDAAIDYRYSRTGDKEAVFNCMEESRARWLLDLITTHAGLTDQAQRQSRQFSTLRDVQQQLPDQMQLIEYAVLDDKLLICLVSRSEFAVKDVRISQRDLGDKVSTFRASILRESSEAFSQGQELYNLLIKPIELSPANGEQICIVPDKILYSLPFVALVSPASSKYVVEDYQITLAPSATVHLACSERTNHTAERSRERLLAVGDPSFDRSSFPSLPSLPTTRTQVGRIGEFYRSSPTVLTGSAATEDAVKRDMVEADVIHLASHYVVYEGDPMNSRLLLAGEGREPGEHKGSTGSLKADEVYALKLPRAPLVVLAACDSGVERYYNGEGMVGMSRVFIAAGAPVVVASLWQVDAYATDELMVGFHRHRMTEAASTSEALTSAQREMLRSGKKQPYYWAGFATIGGRTSF